MPHPLNIEFAANYAYDVGQALIKQGAAPEAVYALAGKFYVSQSGWGLLTVPNALLHGVFDAMDESGIEKPTKDTNDPTALVNAHISVMTADEVEQIGVDRLSERGHAFKYNLGQLKKVNPKGWDN